jgi:hypothetical protein
VLSKAGVAVPPTALIGVPLTVGLFAYLLERARRARRLSPNDVEVVPA